MAIARLVKVLHPFAMSGHSLSVLPIHSGAQAASEIQRVGPFALADKPPVAPSASQSDVSTFGGMHQPAYAGRSPGKIAYSQPSIITCSCDRCGLSTGAVR